MPCTASLQERHIIIPVYNLRTKARKQKPSHRVTQLVGTDHEPTLPLPEEREAREKRKK